MLEYAAAPSPLTHPSSPMDLREEFEPDDTSRHVDKTIRRNSSIDANTEASSDSAVSTSSGRACNAFPDFKDYVRARRQTITSRLPISRIMAPLTNGSPRKMSTSNGERNTSPAPKKPSVDSQFFDIDDENVMDASAYFYHRRLSVPERTLMHANYAILRKNTADKCFDIVGAFHNHQCEAYKNFLKALACYDLAPQHGMIIMLDAALSIHAAVSIMCLPQYAGNRAAMICNAKNKDKQLGIFTVTDCLKCIQLSSEGNNERLREEPLQHYLDKVQSKKKIVSVSSTLPLWDVSRLFRLNRVHRIPVFQESDLGVSSEVLCFVSLRQIFLEILKLLDSKCALTPNLHHITLDSLRLGTWTNIAWIGNEATVGDAINKFLTRKVSCLPLLDEEQNFVGSITKESVLEAVREAASGNYLEVLEQKAKTIIRLDEIAANKVATPQNTIAEVIRMLVYNYDGISFRQCLFIVRERCLLGVVSYADIMEFLLNTNSLN